MLKLAILDFSFNFLAKQGRNPLAVVCHGLQSLLVKQKELTMLQYKRETLLFLLL